jgi:hypothetical protein
MNVWTNTSVRRSNGSEVQLGFGFPHSLALQEEAWLQQLSTINCHFATLYPLPLTGGRQVVVMVGKFASSLRAAGFYEPEARSNRASLTIPMVL